MAKVPDASPPLQVSFVAGDVGAWAITEMRGVAGDTLPLARRLAVCQGNASSPSGAWSLRGVVSHLRYTTASEVAALNAVQAPLGRPQATTAALIPIRKSAEWWALPQDRRREIYQERSGHTTIGLEYLPAIARRLHHSRDLGEDFDFLTWFEFAPEDTGLFDDLLGRLRRSEEWRFVEREVDIRLRRVD